MWTRKDVKEFKESLKKDKDSVIKVGSGETVTVSYTYQIIKMLCSLLKCVQFFVFNQMSAWNENCLVHSD